MLTAGKRFAVCWRLARWCRGAVEPGWPLDFNGQLVNFELEQYPLMGCENAPACLPVRDQLSPRCIQPGWRLAGLGNAYETKPVQLWDLRTGRPVKSFAVEFCKAIAFSHDGQILATVDRDSVVQLWQVSSGQLLSTIQAEDSSAYTLQFSPDDRSLAFVTTNGLLLLDVKPAHRSNPLKRKVHYSRRAIYLGVDTASSLAIIGSGNWSLDHQDAIEFRDLTTWTLKKGFSSPFRAKIWN